MNSFLILKDSFDFYGVHNNMAHSESQEFSLSCEDRDGDDSEEEIEVTAAEVLDQLETVGRFKVVFLLSRSFNRICCSLVILSCFHRKALYKSLDLTTN